MGHLKFKESSRIDPATILSSINLGDQNLFNFESGFPPHDAPFVASVEWKQEDFLNLATSIFHAAWNESTNDWILYEWIFIQGVMMSLDFLRGVFIIFRKLQIVTNILGVALEWNLNMDMLRGVEIPIAAAHFLGGR